MTAPTASPEQNLARLLWTAGVLMLATLPHFRHIPLWVVVLLGVCIVWRLAAALWGWPLPRTLWRAALAFLAFSAVFVTYRTINGLEAGSALLIVMVALKFLETRQRRDHLVLMMIAYFLVFAGLLATHELLFMVYLITVVWVTTVGFLQLSRRGPLLDARETGRLAGRLLLQALPIMVALFVFFPRLPGPLWSIPSSGTSGRTGLDSEMSPGDITELGLSDAAAFRVDFAGRPPPAAQLYWRGPVLGAFNGRTWSNSGPQYRPQIQDTLQHEGEATRYRVMLEPTGRRWLVALDMPRLWSNDRDIYMDGRYQLMRSRRRGAVRSRIDDEVVSHTEFRALDNLPLKMREGYLQLPEGSNPRTHALAKGWRAADPEPTAIIRNALNYFRSNGFYYTLTPPPLGANPADQFVFETREGFCEHFASAFTVMMRAAGIPARVVTGYQGGELNPVGEYFIIRQSDAHAWTEVWLAGEGWVRVDPTGAVAPDRIAAGLSRAMRADEPVPGRTLARLPWLRNAYLLWDAANTYWNDWVLGYGPELQRTLMQRLGFQNPGWQTLLALAAAVTALLLLALTAYLTWSFGRRARPDQAQRLYLQFCRRLARLRLSRARHEAPRAFADRASRARPDLAATIDAITEEYLQIRYEPDAGPDKLSDLGRLIRDFRPASR
jgi:transglutaminase-like putative cysteine protease